VGTLSYITRGREGVEQNYDLRRSVRANRSLTHEPSEPHGHGANHKEDEDGHMRASKLELLAFPGNLSPGQIAFPRQHAKRGPPNWAIFQNAPILYGLQNRLLTRGF
jgi:hypothetical protein